MNEQMTNNQDLSGEDFKMNPPDGWGFIYFIQAPSGKGYVGQTRRSIYNRLAVHKCYQKRGCPAVFNAFQKYGDEMRVTIIEACPFEWLNNAETYHIRRLNTLAPNGYNLNEGGNARSVISEETREKLRKALTGRVLPEESRRRGAEKRRGQKHSPEALIRIRAANQSRKGMKLSDETRRKMSESRKGHVISPETREKIAAAQRGKTNHVITDETRRRLSEAQRRRYCQWGINIDDLDKMARVA